MSREDASIVARLFSNHAEKKMDWEGDKMELASAFGARGSGKRLLAHARLAMRLY